MSATTTTSLRLRDEIASTRALATVKGTASTHDGEARGLPAIEPESATALDTFRATVARRGDRHLVHDFDQSITVDQIDAMSDALAVALQQRGTEPGDRITIYLQNVPQVVIAVLAAWKCGAVVVPCNPMLRERELATILGDSGARVLTCQDVYERWIGLTVQDTILGLAPLFHVTGLIGRDCLSPP